MKKIISCIVLFLAIGIVSGQSKKQSKALPAKPAEKELIIRLDDVGMCHAANSGAELIFATGIPVSASLMTVGPWFDEAAKILKKYPNVAVGIHLALNAEWDNYKWGPVLGQGSVPSLVDSNGYLTHKNTWFLKDSFKIEELERELEAQILRALNAGIKVDYIDGHMGAFFMFPEHVALVEKMAKKYKLGISGYFNEQRMKGAEGYYHAAGFEEFLKSFESASPGLTLMVSHPGADTPEMQALSQPGKNNVAKERAAVAEYFSSERFREEIKKQNIRLVNYRMVSEEKGLTSMKSNSK